MNKEKIAYYAHLTITVLGVIVGVFVFLRYLFLPVLPFLIAWATALLLRPTVRKISDKAHLSRKAVGATLSILTVCVGIGIFVAVITYALSAAAEFLGDFLGDERLYDILSKITNPIGSLFGDGERAEEIEAYFGETIKGALTSLLSGIGSVLGGIIKGIPRVLFFILITVISAVYFSIDLDNVNAQVLKRLPDRAGKTLRKVKNSFLVVGAKYVRSYLLLMLMTFFIMLAGFMILRVKNSLFVALIVAFLDLLPLIGVGTVLVPWSIYQMLFGSVSLGVGLLVLFVLNEIIRQFAEPKILGKNLGIHPIISLILLYVGYSLFGFLGLFFVPIVSAVFNVLINKNNSAEVGEHTVGKTDDV